MNITETKMPRGSRTPISEAAAALSIACDFWVEMVGDQIANAPDSVDETLPDPESFFFETVFADAWNDPTTSGDKLADELKLLTEDPSESNTGSFSLPETLEIIVAYAVQAMKAEKDGRHDEAWTYALDAHYFVGCFLMLAAEKKFSIKPAAALAALRHAEHAALKNDAIKYWRDNIDPNLSASKAANELLNIVTMSHKKLAEIISAEKKRRQ